MKVKYQSNDGKLFNTKKEALEHENNLQISDFKAQVINRGHQLNQPTKTH